MIASADVAEHSNNVVETPDVVPDSSASHPALSGLRLDGRSPKITLMKEEN